MKYGKTACVDSNCYMIYLVGRNLGVAQIRQAENHDKGRKDLKFKVGHLVLKRNRKLSQTAQHYTAKLAPRFSGPFTITHVISPIAYEITNDHGKIIPKIHILELEPSRSLIPCSQENEGEPGEEERASDAPGEPPDSRVPVRVTLPSPTRQPPKSPSPPQPIVKSHPRLPDHLIFVPISPAPQPLITGATSGGDVA